MSVILRVMLIIFSLLTCVYIARKIKKSKFKLEDAIFWMLFSLILVVLGVFPQVARFFANFLGIASPVNFVFLVIIFLLILKLFSLSKQVAEIADKQKQIAQRFALDKEKNERKIEEEGEE